MFDRILVVVDGDATDSHVAELGYDLARTYGASVDLLTVLDSDDWSDDGATERASDVLEEATAVEGAPDAVETHVESGRSPAVITEFADERDADLVVMARRGRQGLGERLLGSVAERVLRRTTVPVLTTPDGESRDVGRIDDVLVTTDGSEVAERAAPYAGDLAARYGATLHLLSVVDVVAEAGVFDAGGVDAEFVERLESACHDGIDRFEETLGEVDVERERCVERGVPHEEIVAYVTENDVDLLVMASEGQNNVLGQRLGSVAARVLRNVEVPVLIVPTPG